jgi:phospholipid/cholesterol/gamma-HCH transport system ATP-binding protein
MNSINPVVFSVQNLSKAFAKNPVLKHISFDVKEEQTLALVGPSGVGKSVLFRCMLGLTDIDYGNVLFKNRPIESLRSAFFQDIGVVFQHSALFDSMTVYQNVAFALARRGRCAHPKKAVQDALHQVEFSSRYFYTYPHELSGGMRRRVSIARAIVSRPKILFLDEPTAGLDPIASYQISTLIHSIQKEYQTTCLTITHDVLRLPLLADHVCFLYNQEVLWFGPSQTFLTLQEDPIRAFVYYGTCATMPRTQQVQFT